MEVILKDHVENLGRRGDVLELLVAVAVPGVGRLLGLADGEVGDAGRDQVDARVDRLGEDRDGAGGRAREQLERDQQRVGDDREQRGA